MSKVEILAQIPNLTPEERNEIRQKLDELDGHHWNDADGPLTSEEKALLDARLADMEGRPETSIPWAEAEARLKARFGE
jgi:putative addiction module component (TIGR02574 family)